MLSDFDLIVHRLPKCDEARLYIIGDLHVGAIEANLKGWEAFKNRILEDEHAYICILGDLMNNALKSSVSNSYDDTMRPREQKLYLIKALRDLAPRILCIVPGNHEGRSCKDADDEPLFDIACSLGLENVYRPNAAFVKIGFGSMDKGYGRESASCSYTLCVTHGAGGGGRTGSAVNKNESFAMVFEGIDILAVGHTHKGSITKPSKLVLDSRTNKITQKTMVVITACSWLSYGGYALNQMLHPASAQDPDNPQTILLSGNRENRYIKTVW